MIKCGVLQGNCGVSVSVVLLLVMLGLFRTPAYAFYPARESMAVHAGEDAPPAPRSDAFDWIQLKNGEWLKGEIKDLQDRKLSFKSDELDTFELNWRDVYAVYSAKESTCVFEDRSTILGIVRVESEDVIVLTAEGEQHYNRSDLRAIIPGGMTEWDYWSLKYSLGITSRQGNTDYTDLSSILTIQRRSPGARTRMELRNTYSSFEDKTSADNHLAWLRHDIFLTRRLFVTVPTFEFYRDEFQNVEYRLTPGALLGYEIMYGGDVEWSIGGGGGYQYTRFDAVEPDEDRSVAGAAVLAGTDLSVDLTEKLELELIYYATFGLIEDLGTSHHVLGTLSFDVWGDLDLDVSIQWDRVDSSQRALDDNEIDKDDLRLFVGVGWEL